MRAWKPTRMESSVLFPLPLSSQNKVKFAKWSDERLCQTSASGVVCYVVEVEWRGRGLPGTHEARVRALPNDAVEAYGVNRKGS